MKKHIIIFIICLLVLLGAGAYFFYQHWHQESTVEVWSLVPESAAMVYETDQLLAVWEKVSASPLWENLSAIPDFDTIAMHMEELDSIHSLEFFADKQVLIGIHVVTRKAFDFSYFFKIENSREHTALRKFLDDFSSRPDIQSESRKYNGFEIYELSNRKSGRRFSYVLHKNIFAGSFTPFLVEDIVRNIDTEFEQFSFRSANSGVMEMPRLADDEGNLYINFHKIPLLLSVFTGKEVQKKLQPLNHLAHAVFLDANLTDNQILLNGFSTVPDADKAAKKTFLGTFQGQQPGGIGIKSYIPERTAALLHMTFSDPMAWQKKLHAYQKSYDDAILQKSVQYRSRLESSGIDVSFFFSLFRDEAGIAVLESVDLDEPHKILIIGVSDTARMRKTCVGLNENIRLEEGELPYQETFAGYNIGEVQFAEFPAALLGPVALGFNKCFYMFTGDYWIMSNSIRALKRMILDREAENTWNKSILFNRFLETTVDQANLSFIVNTTRAWQFLLRSLSPEWQQFAQQYAEQFRSFEHLAVQFSESDSEFYTSIAVNYAGVSPQVRNNRQFRTAQQVFYDNPVSTRPFVVRNHTSQEWEVVLQDDSNYFYLTSAAGEILWRDSLDGSIIGEVQQLDFYNNGNLQYFFATAKAIHILDRNGDYVEGYPLYMPEGVSIQYLSLIDYDNTKRYRFLVSDTTGKLWMFNKDRENLEGWNPKLLDAPLAMPPEHIRIRDQDFILAVQQDGTINLFNRRGELYDGFPVSLNSPVKSPVFIAQGSGASSSTMTTITTQGEVVAFNVLGNVVRREQLYRPSSKARFALSVDALNKTYVIVRQDESKLGILDKKGALLFEKSYMSPAALSMGMLEVQYYNFGAGNDLFAITDKVQEFTYLFDAKGNLIKGRPIESRFGVGILFYESEGQYHIYRSYGNEFSIISFANN